MKISGNNCAADHNGLQTLLDVSHSVTEDYTVVFSAVVEQKAMLGACAVSSSGGRLDSRGLIFFFSFSFPYCLAQEIVYNSLLSDSTHHTHSKRP